MSRFEFVMPESLTSSSPEQTVAQPKLSSVYRILATSRHVVRLHMAFECDKKYATDVTPILEEMDSFMGELPALEGVVLQFPPHVMMNIKKDVEAIDAKALVPDERRGTYQLWRSFNVQGQNAKVERRLCLYPESLSPVDIPSSWDEPWPRGYWIIEGLDDSAAD